ncbi:MAG: universal stress protein [Candidatus Thiodiazotropha sp. (ex Monitilora ramsayi)]|nr:universal stress protein [Candidatus Thiodiazotropha sp. (ex Monitilora ramsayi)]
MADYEHILVTVDFSSESDCVIDKALELAAGQSAKVSFIHVVEYSGYLYPPDTPLPVDLDLEQQFIEKAKEQLSSVAESKGAAGAPQYVEVGSPSKQIVHIAQEHVVDLIVLGSHGRHGLQRILGSTASGVLHSANCDVLAVRFGVCKT